MSKNAYNVRFGPKWNPPEEKNILGNSTMEPNLKLVRPDKNLNANPPKPPRPLKKAGSELGHRITSEYAIEDAGGLETQRRSVRRAGSTPGSSPRAFNRPVQPN